jgi:hypothetical protein
MRRRLALSKETLAELQTEELVAVNGAAPPTGYRTQCVEDLASRVIQCYSIFYPCDTGIECANL